MNILLDTLGDPIWQIGGGIIMLAALVPILALHSTAPICPSRRGTNGSGRGSLGSRASHAS